MTKWTTTSWEWRSTTWIWQARLRRQGDCEWREYRSIWTPANLAGRLGTGGGTMAMIKPHWKFSRYLEGYGDLAEPLERWDWTPIFWHLNVSHFGSGICILFHRRRCAGSQSGQNGANFGVYPLDSHAICYCCRFQHGARPAVGDWVGSEPGPEGPALSCRRWGTRALQVVGELLILLLSQILCNLSGGESHLSTIRHANLTLACVCSLRPLPHRSA